MMSVGKSFVVAVTMILGSVAAAANASGTPAGSVLIAVEGPMTGPQASTGIDMLRGAQLAASQINAGGGVDGKQIQIVPADDRADPSTGIRVAHRMIARGVVGVIGPFNSSVGVKNLPIYRRAGVTILRLTSATNTQGFGVTTQPMVNQIAPVEAMELSTVLRATSVDVLFDPSTYTAGIARQLVGLLQANGVSVPVNRSLSPTATAAQQSAALEQVRSTPASVTYLAMYGPQAGVIAKDLYGTNTGPTHGPLGLCFIDLAAQGPDFVNGAGAAVASSCLSSGVPAATQLPGGQTYAAAYEARFGVAPGTWGAFTYDSLNLFANSGAHVHSWRGPQVRKDLAQTSSFPGVTGSITIEPGSGNRVNPPVVILDIDAAGQYVVDPTWAADAGYQLPASS
jgi:branched-chain amino acid transport system substrate-binding protein